MTHNHITQPITQFASHFATVPAGYATAMVRLLARLSRKGATVELTATGYVIVAPGNPRAKRSVVDGPDIGRLVPREVVAYAIERGWIAGDAVRWRLTEAGALALRRGLDVPITETSGPVAVSVYSPPEQISGTISAPTRFPRIGERRRRFSAAVGPQAQAAQRLGEGFIAGQMMPRVTANWDRAALGALPDGGKNASGLGVEMSDRTSSAQERVRRALDDAGPEFAGVLIDLCCLEIGIEAVEAKRGWPRRSAKVVLNLALDRPARHYGIIAQGPKRGRTQQWGTQDYRPSLDGRRV